MPYLFIILNVADAALTAVGIYRGKTELNPVVWLLMQQIGLLPALVLVKSIAIAVVLTVARQIPLLLPIGCLVMAGVVVWNVSELAS